MRTVQSLACLDEADHTVGFLLQLSNFCKEWQFHLPQLLRDVQVQFHYSNSIQCNVKINMVLHDQNKTEIESYVIQSQLSNQRLQFNLSIVCCSACVRVKSDTVHLHTFNVKYCLTCI